MPHSSILPWEEYIIFQSRKSTNSESTYLGFKVLRIKGGNGICFSYFFSPLSHIAIPELPTKNDFGLYSVFPLICTEKISKTVLADEGQIHTRIPSSRQKKEDCKAVLARIPQPYFHCKYRYNHSGL